MTKTMEFFSVYPSWARWLCPVFPGFVALCCLLACGPVREGERRRTVWGRRSAVLFDRYHGSWGLLSRVVTPGIRADAVSAASERVGTLKN